MTGLTKDHRKEINQAWASDNHNELHQAVERIVASLLAAARAEGAEKARAEVVQRVEDMLGGYPTHWNDEWADILARLRAALAGGERDE